jgi:hypothetical protein
MEMPKVFAIVAISLVSLQLCSALQIYHSHSTMVTGFCVGEQSLPFAVWNARTTAKTPSKRCTHESLTHTTVGTFENTKTIHHQLFIARLKSRIASMAVHRGHQVSLLCLNPTKKSTPRQAVAYLALFLFCLASKSAFAADAMTSPCQQLLADGVSSPLRYFSNFLPAGWRPCPPQ